MQILKLFFGIGLLSISMNIFAVFPLGSPTINAIRYKAGTVNALCPARAGYDCVLLQLDSTLLLHIDASEFSGNSCQVNLGFMLPGSIPSNILWNTQYYSNNPSNTFTNFGTFSSGRAQRIYSRNCATLANGNLDTAVVSTFYSYVLPTATSLDIRFAVSLTDGRNTHGVIWTLATGGFEYPLDPVAAANCTIQTANITFDFQSNSLNVAGINAQQNLEVSCTTGTPTSYKLALTGTNVTNGNLNFGNNVSASVTLNNTAVSANGNSISLGNLGNTDTTETKSVPIKVTLNGTASANGTSSASGVLLLTAD